MQRIIAEARRKDERFASLLSLIDHTKTVLDFKRDLIDPDYQPLGIIPQRDFTLRFLAGDLTPNDNHILINELSCESSSFYDELLDGFDEAYPETRIPLFESVPLLARLLHRPTPLTRKQVLAMVNAGNPSLLESIVDSVRRVLDPFPNWAVVAVSAGVCFVALLLVFHQVKDEPFAEYFVYDDKVPYEVESSPQRQLKSTEQGIQAELKIRLARAQSRYLSFEYDEAVEMFARSEAFINRFGSDPAHAAIVLDYYFYWGLSHLGLARSERSDIDAVEKDYHLRQAAERLARAADIAQEHNPDAENKIRYFLALAHGFGNNRHRAVEILEALSPEAVPDTLYHQLLEEWRR